MIGRIGFGVVVAVFAATGWTAQADDGPNHVSARLEPGQEVPAVSSPAARGAFEARIDDDDQMIEYSLTFSGLQAAVTQSHIHFAQRSVNGAIVVWLCGTPAPGPTGPPGTQTCPQSGTITGTITPANVIASPPAQGIAAGDFDEVLAAIRNGLAYVNVHTAQSPGGEIRGQIRRGGDGDDDGDSGQ